MRDELVGQVREKTGSYFKEGYNCAESVFLAFREYLAPDMDPETVKLVTGFGGGLGHAGCLCGALSASIMALDMLKGRTSKEGSRKEAYELASEFHDRFKKEFGGTCCRVLNKHPFGTVEQRSACLKTTGNAAKLLMEFLLEKELYHP